MADPGTTWSLALFQQAAAAAIAGIHARGHLPLLVGGTGQYIHAVTHGWTPPVTSPDARLRAELESRAEQKGYQALHEELQTLDPAAAEKIDPRNVRRTDPGAGSDPPDREEILRTARTDARVPTAC